LSLERSPSIINRTSLSCEYASCFEVKQTNIGNAAIFSPRRMRNAS
jgi:hypothetical protein